MGKVFKGQVKVQDIKDEFDRLVNSINSVVDQYNETLDAIGGDLYGEGSGNLAAPGYTLTVGGLKVLMNAYRGCAVGSKVYKLDDTTAVVTRGVYFSDDGDSIINLPQDTVAIDGNTRYIYYDKVNNKYTATPNTNTVRVSRINANRNSKLISTFPFDAEGIGLSIRCGSNNVNPKKWQTPDNANVGCFGRPWQPVVDKARGNDTLYFDNKQIGYTAARNESNKVLNYFCWAPVMYFPKGVESPFYHRFGGSLSGEGGVQIAPCAATITRNNN